MTMQGQLEGDVMEGEVIIEIELNSLYSHLNRQQAVSGRETG